MPNDYVDKITLHNGTVYDIKDSTGGGTKLYLHEIKFNFSFTYNGTPYSNIEGTYKFISNKSTEFKASDFYVLSQTLSTGRWKSGTTIIFDVSETYLSPLSPGSFGYAVAPRTYSFLKEGCVSIAVSHPGASPSLEAYGPDKIDLTTGELMSRTNLYSNTSVTITSDTVTEL